MQIRACIWFWARFAACVKRVLRRLFKLLETELKTEKTSKTQAFAHVYAYGAKCGNIHDVKLYVKHTLMMLYDGILISLKKQCKCALAYAPGLASPRVLSAI